jgi:hypothetical protein
MVEGRTYAMNHDNDADDDAAECGGNNDGNSIISVEWDCLTAPYALDDGGGGYSWWTMPSGVRSYNAMEVRGNMCVLFLFDVMCSNFMRMAISHFVGRRMPIIAPLHPRYTKKNWRKQHTQYEGFEESERMVIDGIFPKSNNDRCAYDIILAHSQGAILMSAILSMRERLWNGGGGGRPYGYILNGCAWPNPYGYSLSSMADGRISGIIDDDDDDPSSSLPRVLFIMGREDVINPIDSAMRVHDAHRDAKFDASIVMHDGGHSVPMGKDGDSARALGEVVDWIVGIARRKASSRCG